MCAIGPVANQSPDGVVELRENLARFMAAKRLRWRPKTFENYRAALNDYADHAGDHWPPTVASILDWLEAVRARASETTAASYWGHVRAFLNYLEETGAIADNPARTIKRLKLAPRPPRKGPVSFTRKELDRLFGHLTGLLPAFDVRRDLAILRLLYATGMRSGECCTLCWSQVDLADRAVIVKAVVAKNGLDRTIYLNRAAWADLDAWGDELFVTGYRAPWVFPALRYDNRRKVHLPAGRPLTIYGINQMFHRRLDGAGIGHRKVHALRHSHILHALQAGIPIHQVRDQVGHRSTQSTEAYLAGWDDDRRRSYRNFLEGNIDSA